MGMFNYVDVKLQCPHCDRPIPSKDNKGCYVFQSKDRECLMSTLNVNEVTNFYGDCSHCGKWVEYERIPNDNDTKFNVKEWKLVKER